MLVDMGFMFGGASWEKGSLNLPAAYVIPVHIAEKLTLDKIEPVIAALEGVEESHIRECFEDVPEQWGVTMDDALAAAEVVLARRSKIRDIIKNGNPQIQ